MVPRSERVNSAQDVGAARLEKDSGSSGVRYKLLGGEMLCQRQWRTRSKMIGRPTCFCVANEVARLKLMDRCRVREVENGNWTICSCDLKIPQTGAREMYRMVWSVAIAVIRSAN